MKRGGSTIYFAELDHIGESFEKMIHYQKFEIRGGSLIEHFFDSELIDGMFILSDKNEKGQPAAIVH